MKKRHLAIALLTASLVCGVAGFVHHGAFQRLQRLENVTTAHEDMLLTTEAYAQLRCARNYWAAGMVLAAAAFALSLVIGREIKRQRREMASATPDGPPFNCRSTY